MQRALDLRHSTSVVSFTWAGCDEMDEVSGDGHAELLDEGTIEITFAYHNATRPYSRPNRRLLQQPARLLFRGVLGRRSS